MKILQLGKFYPVRGGVEKVMYDLTSGLSERGIKCDMLCATLEKPGIIKLNDCGRIICVEALRKIAGTMIAPAMIKYLKEHHGEYDIIHVHHPDPMAALALYMSGYQGKVVLHWHSDIVSQKEFYYLYKPLQNWLVQRSQRIVGTTPVYVKESPHLAKAQDKCTYVPIGIKPKKADDSIVAKIRKRYKGKKLLLSIGRMVPYKGYSYLVDAMLYLENDYHLVIGGEGPLFDKIMEKVFSMHLEDRITLLGYVPDNELPSWFEACNVFVLPSVMKTEAFGIVQIEAMSHARPIVATTIPGSGVSWVNREGVSGLNARPRDPEALAETIKAVYNREDKYGFGALQLFKELYQLDSMVDKVIKIYENL